jgi:hypothetical protein
MINKADRLRTPAEMGLPDVRQHPLVVVNMQTGETRPKTLEDHYARVKAFALSESVPDKIQTHFEVAKNLLLYSWFVHNFISPAEMQAYASAEYALRARIGTAAGTRSGLRRLFDQAIKDGLIQDTGFRHYQHLRQRAIEFDEIMQALTGVEPGEADPPDPQSYCRVLAETFPPMRNEYAHGSSTLSPGVYLTFSLCCDLINQLFAHEQAGEAGEAA